MKKKENVKGNKSLAKWYIIPALAILLSLAAIGVAAGQSVSIDPASQSVSAGDTFTVDVAVDPAEYGVSSGEINIAFDADAMQADSIEPGDLLGTNPLVGTEEIDNTAGTIIYALARIGATTPPTPEGSFATITFTVDSDAPDGTYDIDITTVGLADEIFEDISGITINDGAVTVAEPDTTPPTIISVSPTGGATGVVITTTISATFSEAMNEASAKAAFSITPDVAGTFSWVWNTMTFTPDANLAYSTKYTVTIGTDAQDLAGNPMASAYSWSFTTESAPAVPTVSIDPASQSVSTGDTFTVDVVVDPAGYGVSGGEINIAFDADAMQADSIEPGDLFGATPIVGSEEIDNTVGTIRYALARVGATTPPTPESVFATVTFTVKSDATPGTYDIDITTVGLADEIFEDISGITINDGTVTVAEPDTTPPAIISVSPTDGDTGVVITTTISATFSEAMNEASVEAAFSITPDVAGTFSWVGNTMTYTPDAYLAYSTKYTVTIGTGAQDLADNPMTSAYSWSFTTKSAYRPSGKKVAAAKPGETSVSTDPTTNVVTNTATATSADKKAVATITAGTIAKVAGARLTKVTVIPPSELPAALPAGVSFHGFAYNFGPEGATFDPAIEIAIEFDPTKFANTPVIYVYEAGAWKALKTTVVGNRATAMVTHFSTFVLFDEAVAPPPGTPTPTPTVTATPTIPTVTPTPTLTPTPSVEPPAKPWGLIIGIIVAVIIVGAAAYYFYTKKKA